MPSGSFAQTAHDIVIRDRPVFNMLMDYEKTKRIRTKERVNFTVDKSTFDKFRRLCKEKGYNMSAQIERAMNEFVRKNQ